MLVEERPRRVPELSDLARRDHAAPHVIEGGGAADSEDLGNLIGSEQFVAGEAEWTILSGLSTIRPPTGPYCQNVDHLLARTAVEDHAPLPDSQTPEAVGALEPFDVPSGSSPMAAAIRCRSLRPNRRSDLSAAGRTSTRQPPGWAASVQLRLDLRPGDTRLLPRLLNRQTIPVGSAPHHREARHRTWRPPDPGHAEAKSPQLAANHPAARRRGDEARSSS